MADDTFVTRGWKPLLLANPVMGFGEYRDNGGVVYAAYAVTRTGETFNSRDISKCASTNDHPLGVPIEIIHMDATSWDYDEIAADNDIVKVAEIGSGHVVTIMLASAQGDVNVGRLLAVDSAGRAIVFVSAASGTDSIDAIRKDLQLMIGRAYEGCEEDDSDPKDNIFIKLVLNV